MSENEAVEPTQDGVMPATVLNLSEEQDREDYHRLLLFLSYLGDFGIQAQIVRLIARDIYSGALTITLRGSDATAIFNQAHDDIGRTDTGIGLDTLLGVIGGVVGPFLGGPSEQPTEEPVQVGEPQGPPTYDIKKIAAGAISLELLVGYARALPDFILPAECLPTAAFVERCLRLFHELKRQEAEAEL